MTMTDDTARPQPLPGLSGIAAYVPGKAKADDGRKVWKLSSNESALGASPKAIEAMAEAARGMHIYPDGAARDLKAAIAEVEGLDPARLVIGSGSDEILQLLIKAYAGPGDNIVQSAHGFSYYAIAAAAARVETRFAAERALTADPEAIAAEVDGRTRLVFLANPNSPTGTVLMAGEVRRLRELLPPRVILVLDGAYAEYMEAPDYTDGRDLVDTAAASGVDNVVMTRTFSKIYGLGGARVGWGYGPESVMSILERIRPPFNITLPSLAAAEAAMRDQAFVAENKAFTLAERARLAAGIAEAGFETVPSHCNFVLFDAGSADRAKALLAHLEKDGILVRSAASSFLPAHLRVTVGPREATDAFLASLATFAD